MPAGNVTALTGTPAAGAEAGGDLGQLRFDGFRLNEDSVRPYAEELAHMWRSPTITVLSAPT
mgnify:CR=1 FL=1